MGEDIFRATEEGRLSFHVQLHILASTSLGRVLQRCCHIRNDDQDHDSV